MGLKLCLFLLAFECWGQVRNELNEPYVLDHGYKVKNSVLLIHGLTDSPYYTRAIAEILYSEGFNVVGILLSGHGTRPEDLLKTKLTAWIVDTQKGFQIAQSLGENIYVGGLSLGGALSIHLSRHQPLIKGLFLFSPAILVRNWESELACGARYFQKWVADTPEQSLVRYNKMAVNSVCQINRLIELNQYGGIAHQIAIPTFIAMTDDDQTILPWAIKNFYLNLRSPHKALVEYPVTDHVGHADLVRPELNPKFQELEEKLRAFIKENTRT